jgi:hypothetical protein
MRYLIFALILLLAGCSSFNDVTKEIPYDFLLGDATTSRAAFLCDDETLGFFKPEIGSELVINHGFEKCVAVKHVISIPKGAHIKLKRIVKHTGYGLFVVKRWYVIGQYEDGRQKYDFVYLLPWIQDNEGIYMGLDKKEVPWTTGV